MSSNIDKIIPGDNKRTIRPKSSKDIKRKCFYNNIGNSIFIQKKTANKYNKQSHTDKSKRES